MLYTNVKRILDKSKTAHKDVYVASRMLIEENPEEDAQLEEAFSVIQEYYDIITKSVRLHEYNVIKNLCELVKIDDEPSIQAYIKRVTDRRKQKGI